MTTSRSASHAGVLLAALVREGPCTADEREALLSYPGHSGEPVEAEAYLAAHHHWHRVPR